MAAVSSLPTTLDPEFVADCPYGPDGLLLERIVAIDPERSYVAATMATHDDLPLTRTQRAHPVFHPRHVSGGLTVHMTGMIALVHSYYVLGLRHREGWIGYGGKINLARFKALATMGPPMLLECTAKQVRQSARQVLARYEFRFTQEEKVTYEGDQTALWMKVDGRA